jgi:hypothetical protein
MVASSAEQYRHFDPELFDLLIRASAEPDWRRLDTVEARGAIPGHLLQ